MFAEPARLSWFPRRKIVLPPELDGVYCEATENRRPARIPRGGRTRTKGGDASGSIQGRFMDQRAGPGNGPEEFR